MPENSPGFLPPRGNYRPPRYTLSRCHRTTRKPLIPLDVPPALLLNAMKITEEVRRYAAEQKLGEEEALNAVMDEKSKEFTEAGAEVYVPA